MKGPELVDPLPPDWEGYPEQMSHNDFIIWSRFIDIYSQDFKQFYYNVCVGEPTMWAEGLEEDMARMVEHVSRRRIDVVGEKKEEWWLMEIRMNAGPGAIGSVLTYKTLWEENPPDKRLVTPVIVTDYTDPNLIRVCSILNIIILVV